MTGIKAYTAVAVMSWGGSLMASLAQVVVGENTPVTLGLALGALGVLLGPFGWLWRRMKSQHLLRAIELVDDASIELDGLVIASDEEAPF